MELIKNLYHAMSSIREMLVTNFTDNELGYLPQLHGENEFLSDRTNSCVSWKKYHIQGLFYLADYLNEINIIMCGFEWGNNFFEVFFLTAVNWFVISFVCHFIIN